MNSIETDKPYDWEMDWLDPFPNEVKDRLGQLVGRRLEKIEVVTLGVMFHFGSKNGDNGIVYWAIGNESNRGKVNG